ncbi:MAG TPA: hypothetical protein PKW79_03655 [Rhabdochlamydiaceae bacterium]|nr:hypothetical protein [Rhabdochlamydiaceae bacterium]
MRRAFSRRFALLFCFWFFWHGTIDAAEPKICLAIQIKNDEATIKDCLSKARGVVDCIAISDIGSTDKTVAIIKQFLQETGIPGVVYKTNKISFPYNKTLLIQQAKQTLVSLKMPLDESYILVVDGEMVLNINPHFDKKELTQDGYLLLERFKAPTYYQYQLRLLKASLNWENIGFITDKWVCAVPYRSEKLSELMFEHLKELSYSEDQLLEKTDHESAVFLLAHFLKASGRLEEAIQWYHKRVALGGDQEEIWFSKFMIGSCFQEKGEWDKALHWYLEAHQFNPKRVDSLVAIASHYRYLGQNDLAYLFASYGVKIPFDESQTLFYQSPLHRYQFYGELSIAAYYTPFRDEGFAAADALLLTKNVPDFIKNQTYQNILFYVEKLSPAHFQPIEFELPLIQEGLSERYYPMNPSIIKTEEGYKVICRTVNFTQSGAKFFSTPDPQGIYRTRNFLLEYDREFHLLGQKEIIENLPRMKPDSWIASVIHGLEDCRIFNLGQQLYFTCTTSDTNFTGNFQISVCHVNELDNFGLVDRLIPLIGPDLYRCEKNWLPFVIDNELFTIYSYDPLTVFKPDLRTGNCPTVLTNTHNFDFSRFRGSAAPIEFDQGYLILVHEVVFLPDYTRNYLHRFLYLDHNFIVRKVSKPFVFHHFGIEYCCGMVADHEGRELVLSIGIEDRQAYFCFLGFDALRAMLYNLDSP